MGAGVKLRLPINWNLARRCVMWVMLGHPIKTPDDRWWTKRPSLLLRGPGSLASLQFVLQQRQPAAMSNAVMAMFVAAIVFRCLSSSLARYHH